MLLDLHREEGPGATECKDCSARCRKGKEWDHVLDCWRESPPTSSFFQGNPLLISHSRAFRE